MKLRELTKQIKEYEGKLAYGSETSLWGAYWAEYRDKIEDGADLGTTDIDIPDADGEVWLEAYLKMERAKDASEDYSIEDLF